jgi:ornithine cyclodeaminase/alanine dehydrogenase-like protein (mu-crystallin family)
MRMLDADDLLPRIGYRGLVEALRAGHREGIDAVDRSLLTRERDSLAPQHLLVWPAWRHDAYCGVKMVSVFPGSDPSRPTNRTVYVLFDGRDGTPLATITGESFTVWKTAADSALGADYLAQPGARTLLMVGAGAQAAQHVAAHRSVRPTIDRVLVWNRTPARAQALAETLSGIVPHVAVLDHLADAVVSADVIACATGAMEPLIRGEWLRPGTHLDLVGGFTNAMREADDEAARRARFFVDSRRFTIDQCGDVSGPMASGALARDGIEGDLFDLCRGETSGRRSASEITLFKNAGGGHLDLMTAVAIYQAAG